MSGWDDLDGVTPRISNEDAERLLSGVHGIDETPELADLNAVLGALRGPGEPAELTGLQSALVAFGAAVVTAQSDSPTPRTRPMIKKLLTGKALAAIGVVTLASASAAAAAGVVPTPFSSSRPIAATSTEAGDDESTDDTVGGDTVLETVPSTDAATVSEPPESDEAAAAPVAALDDAPDATDGQGPDVNGPAKFGLCTAFEARSKHDDSSTTTTEAGATPPAEPMPADAESDLPVPFQALSDAAEAAGQSVADFCADAVPGGVTAPGQSGDNPSATAPGKSDENPSATAPGKSDENPSATAPGRSGDNPSATAPGRSGGTHGKPLTTEP